jgi:DNA mismatch endonuclease (patch repair protein)
MVDVFSPKFRSEIMAKVKGRDNRATELRLLRTLQKYKIRGWRRRSTIFGNPDFVFPASRLAVFVDGCFWHGCPVHGSKPKSNRAFWMRKLSKNRQRDRLVKKSLTKSGWRVLRIWQHELKNEARIAKKVNRTLGATSNSG